MSKQPNQETDTPWPTPSWDYGGWDGPRRAMLERAKRLTIKERLEEMQALNDALEKIRIHANHGT